MDTSVKMSIQLMLNTWWFLPVNFTPKFPFLFCFFFVNLNAKTQLQITPYLDKPVVYLFDALGNMFNLCVSMFRPEWWIWIWPEQQTLLFPYSDSLSTLTHPSLSGCKYLGHLPDNLWPMTYWQRWAKAGLLLPGATIHCYHFCLRVLWQMSLRPDKLQLQPKCMPNFSLTQSALLPCCRCHPRLLLQYTTCKRIHISDFSCSELDLWKYHILTEKNQYQVTWGWSFF